MTGYTWEPAQPAKLTRGPPSWGEYLEDLANNWSLASASVAVLVPWSLVLGYVLYYWFFKRPAKLERAALGPFLTFYTLLTNGATPGFDKQLMSVFHPAVFKDGNVEKGLLRAMARCLTSTFGPVECVPRETVVLKRDGLTVNCVALVDFSKRKQVACHLSWIRRVVSVKSLQTQEREGLVLPGRRFSPEEVVDGIGMAPLGSFHVTGFHVEQRGANTLDVAKYIKPEEFEAFSESFVERLFERPPTRAAQMMLPALQEKHLQDGAKALEESIQRAVRAAGGLYRSGSTAGEGIDATLTDETLVKSANKDRAAPTDESSPSSSRSSVDAIDMTFHVRGVCRDLEVQLRFTVVGLRCFVAFYEVRLLPDHHTQVVVDRDTGTTTIVA